MKRSDDKKMAVLKVLQEQAGPLGINDLLDHLPNDFAERSVRRWLAGFIKAGLLEKTGQKRSTKYYVPIPFRLLEPADRCFSEASLRVIAKIRRPVFERQPVSYNDAWLEEYKPNRSFYLPLQIRAELLYCGRHETLNLDCAKTPGFDDRKRVNISNMDPFAIVKSRGFSRAPKSKFHADRSIRSGKRSRDADPAGSYAHRIFNRLLIDLSYNSSRLEGNTYSLLETEKLLLEGTSAQEKSEDDKIMILNHKEAIRYLVDSAPKLQVSKETLCTIHYLLSDALVEPHYAGHVRDHEVRIGGSTYIPYADPKKLQKQLEFITKKAALIKDPYEQSFFLLIHLSYLQAFNDVNKRTARLSANISLIKNNLVPLSFNDVGREDYTSAIIAVYELQNIQPMTDLYLFSYKRTCAMYDSTVHSMGVDILRVRYRNQRRQLISEIILEKKIGASIERYIKAQAKKLIPEKDRLFFIEDVQEDLAEIDQSRIYGLGVTLEEFRAWKKVAKFTTPGR